MVDQIDVRELYDAVKGISEAAKCLMQTAVKAMVEHGLAKEIDDGYGGDYVMTIVADPEILKQIDYYVFEDEEPEFWNEASGETITGKIEWY